MQPETKKGKQGKFNQKIPDFLRAKTFEQKITSRIKPVQFHGARHRG